MAFRLPSFADVGFDNPRASGALPNFPASDPGAAGLAALGKGVQEAGGAAIAVSADLSHQRDKLNESTATLDLFNRLVPLQTKIELETDTDKIAEHRAELNALLQTSGQAIDNPAQQKAWMANHAKTILAANKQADERTTLLYRNKSTAISNELLDRTAQTGSSSDDPMAFVVAQRGITEHLDWEEKNGNLLPAQRYEKQKLLNKQLVEGRVLNLVAKGKTVEAQALLDTRGDLIGDPIQRETFRARIEAKAETMGADAAANRALGLAPALPGPRVGQSSRSGGWGPHADTAIDEFRKAGASDAFIRGALANGLGEGGFAQAWQQSWVDAKGAREESYGHWQLNKNGELPGYLAAEGKGNPSDTRAQARFLLRRMEEIQPGITKAGNDRQATDIIATKFEKYVGAAAGQRYGQLAEAAGRIGGQRDAAPSGAAGKPVAIGDSIAAHLIRKAGVGGTEYNDVYKDDSTAVSGHGPAAVLGTIGKTPEANIKGRDVLLSTGVSNDPAQIDMVADQIKALKARGARSVTVLGVGTADKVRGANDALSQIAADNGAVFAGPMRKVAGDGIHSSDPKDLLQQAQSVRPAGPAAQSPVSTAPAPPNRTGLPTLVEIEQSIATDPAVTTDRARAIAFEKAKTKYSAFEADAARAERIATAAQKAAVDARITEYQRDAYSDNPKYTARSIIDDPTFNSDPKLREHMIGFINNPPGSGVPAPQSYAAALRVIERIRLPEGDPQKITDLNQLYDPLVTGRLNKDDFNFAVKQFADIRTPGGELFNKRKTDFLKSVEASIDKSNPLMGKIDESGKQQLYGFHWLLDQKIDEYRKAGKTPADLLDPSKPEFMGKPETLVPHQKTLQQSINDRVKALTPPKPPTPPTPEAPARMTPGAGATAIPGGVSVPIPPMTIEPRKPGETPDEYLRRVGQ